MAFKSAASLPVAKSSVVGTISSSGTIPTPWNVGRSGRRTSIPVYMNRKPSGSTSLVMLPLVPALRCPTTRTRFAPTSMVEKFS